MLSPDVLKKLEAIEQRFEELTHQLSDPAVASSGEKFRKVSKERASLESTVLALADYRKLLKDVADNEALLADADFREMAKEELAVLRPRLEPAEENLKLLLIPKDPNDDKDVIVEVKAGDQLGSATFDLRREVASAFASGPCGNPPELKFNTYHLRPSSRSGVPARFV